MRGSGWARRSAAGVAAGAAAALLTLAAGAAPAPAAGGDYGHWSPTGQSGSVQTPVAGFPAATFTTTSTSPTTPSGTSTYLSASTPFGQEFGSSRGHDYLLVHTAPGGAPSTTTLDFASPTPADRWGFALGDIDADTMRITAVGADGAPLTAAQLGWQGAFNYCAPTPRPSGCKRAPFTDLPTWHPATRTLVGNVADTDGASGWFRPAVPVRSITFTFSVQSGIPVGQIWLAALPGRYSDPPLQHVSAELPSGSDRVVIAVPPVHHEPAVQIEIVRRPEHGTVTVRGDELVYRADPGCPRHGTDHFSHLARNRSGQEVLRRQTVRYERCQLAATGAGERLGALGLTALGLLAAGGTMVAMSRSRRAHAQD